MVAKKPRLELGPRPPVRDVERRLIFGRERQHRIVGRWIRRSHRTDLLGGKVLDPHNTHWLMHVPKPGTVQFIRSSPRSQHTRVSKMLFQVARSGLVKLNVVTVGEVVLKRKAIWRIPEPSRDEQRCQRADHYPPTRQPSPYR